LARTFWRQSFWGIESRYWLFILVIIGIHAFAFSDNANLGQYDVSLYYKYANWMFQGFVPYHDFAVEYPPGALLVFAIPRLFAAGFTPYSLAFALEMLAFDIIGIFLMVALARRFRLSVWLTLLVYTIALWPIVPLAVGRFDLVPAIITLGAIYAFSRGRFNIAWLLLAAGTLVKIYPVILAPLFLIYQLKYLPRWRSVMSVGVFAALFLVGTVPFAVLDAAGLWHSVAVQAGRGLQLESSYSSILLLADKLGLTQIQVILTSTSYNVSSSVTAAIARLSDYILVAGLLGVYAWYFFRRRLVDGLGKSRTPSSRDTASMLNHGFLAIAVFLFTSKVLSPQYMIWLLPLAPIFTGTTRGAVWAMFIMASWLTWYIYPAHYFGLVDKKLFAVVVLSLRNAILAFLAAAAVASKVDAGSSSTDKRNGILAWLTRVKLILAKWQSSARNKR